MGGLGREALSETGESVVCKDPFELLLELAEIPSAQRHDQTLHKTQGV